MQYHAADRDRRGNDTAHLSSHPYAGAHVRYASIMANERRDIPRQKPSASRRAMVAARWILAAAWAALIAFGLPSSESVSGLALQGAVFAVLSLLLANALWQHLSLRSACAVSVIAICLAITVSEAFRSLVLGQTAPESLVAGLCGAILGAVAAYPLLKRVDRMVGSR